MVEISYVLDKVTKIIK